MERRLAAILAADVVGYSRMIRADEEGTLLALRRVRQELIDPKIEEHRGRIVKLMGDGLLIEFASVVDAVACSGEVQHEMAKRNSNIPEDEQIVFRVGINLGDVIIDGDDIQGDGVNVAARLEGLSEPGGKIRESRQHARPVGNRFPSRRVALEGIAGVSNPRGKTFHGLFFGVPVECETVQPGIGMILPDQILRSSQINGTESNEISGTKHSDCDGGVISPAVAIDDRVGKRVVDTDARWQRCERAGRVVDE